MNLVLGIKKKKKKKNDSEKFVGINKFIFNRVYERKWQQIHD